MRAKSLCLIALLVFAGLAVFYIFQRPVLDVVFIVHDVVPVNTSEWEPAYIENNIRLMGEVSETYGINYSLGVIPYTIGNYELSEESLGVIRRFYIVQHGYRHSSNLTEREVEEDVWHEFVDLDYGPIPLEMQDEWIGEGKGIIVEKLGVTPELFIAPQWRYDNATLEALENNGLRNFDIGERGDLIVDSDPTWFLDESTFPYRMESSLRKAWKAALEKKVLVIDTHLQFFNSVGSEYVRQLVDNLQDSYEVRFVTLDRVA